MIAQPQISISMHSPERRDAGAAGLEAPPVQQVQRCQIFAGSGSLDLAQRVADLLGLRLGHIELGKFADGEISIRVIDSCRNDHVFIVQSTSTPVNDNLMELLLMAVVPYYGYARQDRKLQISASDVAMFLEAAGVDRVLSVDLHCGQIQGFFHNIPVDNLTAQVEMCPWVVENLLDSFDDPICVVSPDAGGVARAKIFLDMLEIMGCKDIQLVITIKHRSVAGRVDGMDVVGEVSGRHCIIVDDIVDTAGTLCKSADTLLELGAVSVTAVITHPVFSGPAYERLAKSALKRLVVSDTIPLKPGFPPVITQMSIAGMLAKSIAAIVEGKSLAELFDVARV